MTSRRLALGAAGLAGLLALLGIPLLLVTGSPPAATPEAPVAHAAPALAAAPEAPSAPAPARAAGIAAAPAADATPTSTISVVGEGVVTVTPDVVNMVMGVQVNNPSLAQAQADAASRMNAVIDKLTSLGIAKDDIKTISYDVNPQYEYPQGGGTPILRGFTVSNLVSVKIRDVSRAGQIIDAVISVGATTIQGLMWDLDNPQAARDQARGQAMQDARHKAEQLAAAAGVSLGRPISISESQSGGPQPVPLARGVAAPAAEAAPPPIQPGTTEIRTVVNVTYLIP